MTQTIEREFKVSLTEQQFKQLQAAYPWPTPFTQTNYYYELPQNELQRRHMGLRTRLYQDHAEQTLKVPQAGATRTLLEITDTMPLATAQQLIAQQTIQPNQQIAKYLEAIGIDWSALFIWGQATTNRQVLTLPSGRLTLDQTTYPDQTADYELELEFDDATLAQPFFQGIVSRFKLTQTTPLNKIQRAKNHQS